VYTNHHAQQCHLFSPFSPYSLFSAKFAAKTKILAANVATVMLHAVLHVWKHISCQRTLNLCVLESGVIDLTVTCLSIVILPSLSVPRNYVIISRPSFGIVNVLCYHPVKQPQQQLSMRNVS
jgi:hypothetical protein